MAVKPKQKAAPKPKARPRKPATSIAVVAVAIERYGDDGRLVRFKEQDDNRLIFRALLVRLDDPKEFAAFVVGKEYTLAITPSK